MPTNRREQAARLDHSALARHADERDAFLADACAVEKTARVARCFARAALDILGVPAAGICTGRRGRWRPHRATNRLLSRPLGLGSGGMGDVFRAHDTKLGRDVAIKMLPPVLSHDRERLARFDREARVLATLNHPHIGAIYGLEYATVCRRWSSSSLRGRRCQSGSRAGRRRQVPACRFQRHSRVRVRSPTHSKPRTRKESSIAI